MRRACERGLKVFDYGRSKQGTGSYSFKKNWGFEPQPLFYEYCLYKRDSIPQNNPSNAKYRLLIEAPGAECRSAGQLARAVHRAQPGLPAVLSALRRSFRRLHPAQADGMDGTRHCVWLAPHRQFRCSAKGRTW
jgi:CelD/BcsL family acetyltransferase involved in cellulose biosynthesis